MYEIHVCQAWIFFIIIHVWHSWLSVFLSSLICNISTDQRRKKNTGLLSWTTMKTMTFCLYVHYQTQSVWLCFPLDGGNGGLDGGWGWCPTADEWLLPSAVRHHPHPGETWLTVGSPVHSYPSPCTVFRLRGYEVGNWAGNHDWFQAQFPTSQPPRGSSSSSSFSKW